MKRSIRIEKAVKAIGGEYYFDPEDEKVHEVSFSRLHLSECGSGGHIFLSNSVKETLEWITYLAPCESDCYCYPHGFKKLFER